MFCALNQIFFLYRINRVRKLCLVIFFSSSCLAINVKGILLSKVKECRNLHQLYISHKDSIVYQVEVPHGGTFEFNLPSNSYSITAASKSGCSFTDELVVKDKEIFKELWVKK